MRASTNIFLRSYPWTRISLRKAEVLVHVSQRYLRITTRHKDQQEKVVGGDPQPRHQAE